MPLSEDLLKWYDAHRRTLPWRGTKEPYRIWLSEIMLQQTRTETVERYYARFLEHFPTVFDLASAEEDTVLKLWEGLGYYSRARNLHAAAKLVAEQMNGDFPDNAQGLRALPGIGPYAANAIASIAYDEPVPALDGNQARVLSRILAWDTPLRTPFDLLEPAIGLMDTHRPGDYNQALMDLGASVCIPKRPRCESCPISQYCLASESGDPEAYPRKQPPIVKREEKLTVIILTSSKGYWVRRRPSKGLLGGLYEFPVLEGWLTAEEAQAKLEAQGFSRVRILQTLPDAKHVFTHLVWKMHGLSAEAEGSGEDGFWLDDLNSVAFPSALRVYRKIAEEECGRHVES